MITHCLNLAFLLGDDTPMELFKKGGPVMWPILVISLVGFTVVIERLIFIFRENSAREHEVVEKILEKVEARDIDGGVEIGRQSRDFVARILTYALSNKDLSLSNAFIRAANQEMTRFNQGLATLDTVITAAPLLGLLGTVTGMMRTFGALGGGDIGAAAGQITGGVAEALIATCCGLFIAVTCLFPYNYLNARVEEARHEVDDAFNALELIIKKSETAPPFPQ
ncbi:MAG TPA: MotA/TolQ/ExbB proton channel family protein [Opitutaceae bacterium]|jgi:biopolymer transport protein ExbB|nr:MotA/TolQ/ExbB proton channel family protein [Opitutaceae bacterium]